MYMRTGTGENALFPETENRPKPVFCFSFRQHGSRSSITQLLQIEIRL